MNDTGSPAGGGARQASPATLLTLVLAVALLAGAISGTAVALLQDSGSDSSSPSAEQGDSAAPEDTPPALTTSFAADAVEQVAARALPSVVAIINQFEAQGDLEMGSAGGAGVIVDERGFILTNAHLVQIPGELFVLLPNGEVRPGRLISHDAPFTDVAIVQIPEGGLTAIDIGDSALLSPGETVVAIGSPDIDYYNSVSTGVVSGVERRKRFGNVWFEDLIQTDAAINVGNSGGPLLNLNAEVVGINTFRDLGGGEDPLFGISFAVSSRTFAPIAATIIENGIFQRPYLGVDFVDLTPEVAAEMNLEDTQGTLVQSVTPGSPAEAAGLLPGDVLTMFGEVPLSSQFGLLNALGITVPDAALSIEILRDGQPLTLDVQLEPR